MPPQIADTQKPKANADNIDADTADLPRPAPTAGKSYLIAQVHAACRGKYKSRHLTGRQTDRQWDRLRDALRDCALILKPSQEFMSSWTT